MLSEYNYHAHYSQYYPHHYGRYDGAPTWFDSYSSWPTSAASARPSTTETQGQESWFAQRCGAEAYPVSEPQRPPPNQQSQQFLHHSIFYQGGFETCIFLANNLICHGPFFLLDDYGSFPSDAAPYDERLARLRQMHNCSIAKKMRRSTNRSQLIHWPLPEARRKAEVRVKLGMQTFKRLISIL